MFTGCQYIVAFAYDLKMVTISNNDYDVVDFGSVIISKQLLLLNVLLGVDDHVVTTKWMIFQNNLNFASVLNFAASLSSIDYSNCITKILKVIKHELTCLVMVLTP